MGDQPANAGKSDTRRRRRLWIITAVAGLVAIVVFLLWVTGFGRASRSPDERLADIEAARAIPDSENAAPVYDSLLQDPKATSLSNAHSQTGEPLLSGQPVLYRPWLSKDQPEVDAWIKEHQYIIDRLLSGARFEKCRFPIIIDVSDTSAMDRVRAMRQWGFLLRSAANNDIAEGRVDAAMTKWQCLLQMGNHLRQQPDLIDHLLANSAEEAAMEPMADFIMMGSPTETYLQKIEGMPLPMKDCWAEYDSQTRLTEALISQKVIEKMSLVDYVRHPIQTLQAKRELNSRTSDLSPFDDTGYLYRRSMATARGIRILAAARRYRNATSHWPLSLDEVRASLPEETLTDPINGGPFVYKSTADTLTLYSKGKNNIDDHGRWEPEVSDDWLIWPPPRRVADREQEDTGEEL